MSSMRNRRQAREIALQVLYQLDVQENHPPGGQPTVQQALALFWSSFSLRTDDAAPDADGETLEAETRNFAIELVEGVRGDLSEIDALLGRASRNWRLERMARVDRNLLRLAVYELKHSPDVPGKVAINEAIEIAKRYGTAESPAFVNGVLDRCLNELKRA